jgi:hypothetical protein
MAGLVPAIHVFLWRDTQGVDARHKAGHDEEWENLGADGCTRRCGLLPAGFGNTLAKMSEAEQRKIVAPLR